ncbi:hypothetical protein KO361_04580 [Candidatus Woesearchaeota archaeon]|jgi:hypothetical protein|nr:hypothetical protein [Candidatus Woesearchaeota archaeon]
MQKTSSSTSRHTEKHSNFSVSEAKIKIKQLLGTGLKFDGHFNKCFENLKESQQKELINWIKNCEEKKVNPVQSKKNPEIIGFVKRIGSNVRAILIKKKDKYFIKLFLDKHKYYEDEMTKQGF